MKFATIILALLISNLCIAKPKKENKTVIYHNKSLHEYFARNLKNIKSIDGKTFVLVISDSLYLDKNGKKKCKALSYNFKTKKITEVVGTGESAYNKRKKLK